MNDFLRRKSLPANVIHRTGAIAVWAVPQGVGREIMDNSSYPLTGRIVQTTLSGGERQKTCAYIVAGQPMSDLEIRDELIALLIAGHETTAIALA